MIIPRVEKARRGEDFRFADSSLQIDISDDGFLSLMNDDGDLKDDVRMPDGEIGEKINKLFKIDEKDTSKSWLFLISKHVTHLLAMELVLTF
jgi:hypothetical protein